MSEPMDVAKALLPGAGQVLASAAEFFFGLARSAGLSEQEARAEMDRLFVDILTRAKRIEVAPVFDPDVPPPAPTV